MTSDGRGLTVAEPARQTPLADGADVVVVGGGPGGVPAAIAAARQGADVLIVEHYGFLGGLSTAGLIGPLFGYASAQTDDRMLGGIPLEIIRELQALGGCDGDARIAWSHIAFEPEMMKHALERLCCREGNISFLYHTHAVGVIKDGDRIDCLLAENKSGRSAIRAKVFIDATGDGDVAWHAGCPFTKGRPQDGAMQPMGTKFVMTGYKDLSPERIKQSIETFNQAIDDGTVPVYHPFMGEVSEDGATTRPGFTAPTVTRARGDGTNANDLTRNEIQLRADTLKIGEFARENLPGFEISYLVRTPTQIGVRETRQIAGQYVLTGHECLQAAKFDDGIARGAFFLDIHCPWGNRSSGSWTCDKNCKMPNPCNVFRKQHETLYDTLYLEGGEYYEIPYRCLPAKDVANLLVSGRCISADHGAMSSLRVIGTCFAIGQAAGTAAGMCLERECMPKDLPGIDVRQQLSSNGVPL